MYMFVDNKITISLHFYIVHVETAVHFSICQIAIFTFIFLPVFLFPIIHLAFYFFPLLDSMSFDHFIFTVAVKIVQPPPTVYLLRSIVSYQQRMDHLSFSLNYFTWSKIHVYQNSSHHINLLGTYNLQHSNLTYSHASKLSNHLLLI